MANNRRVKVGVVGCGGICRGTYMDNMMYRFNVVEVVGCADLIDSRAQYIADKYGVKKMTTEEMMNDPEIEVIVNLTYPESHFLISSEAMKPCIMKRRVSGSEASIWEMLRPVGSLSALTSMKKA